MKWVITEKEIGSDFIKEVEEIIGGKVSKCYQCGNCSAGCPVAYEMDYPPNQIIRMVQLGMKDRVLSSNTIWHCAACVTCTTRCPQEVDITGVMDALRIIAQREKYPVKDKEVTLFNKIFLNNIRRYGRQFEAGLIGEYNMRSGHFFKDLTKGPAMLLKGKIKLFPSINKNIKEVKEIFRKAESG